ncbi:tRNA wybutosine-synthesizing protein 2 homolog isoform X2 [Acipenser ruthenus]|uniref:tRNA wybutosine-synthesizing protein 2 homolog isoform X2 n=1 Tax=Acipenser ruthenus TaxID=7906 RepID=UPI0027421379|nr:tRNA wybutosine-synthesizing protein 2 homolog isoform X2 [Acipenser ruthenus]
MRRDDSIPAIATQLRYAQLCRKHLEEKGILDTRFRLQKLADATVALPVLSARVPELTLGVLQHSVAPGSTCTITHIQSPVPSKKSSVRSSQQQLEEALRGLVERGGEVWSEELGRDLPQSWKRHGDLAILGEATFRQPVWKILEPELWEAVASTLGVKRVARMGRVSTDGFRTPTVTLLRGQDGWVQHVDNGIRYEFDVTKCMFSSGNITEKLRIASFNCSGETVVDLYAGIGYFTLPYLVHAGASFVHACEWNPHAVNALRRNLELNGAAQRCQVHQGDNRQNLCLQEVCDPSSPAGKAACDSDTADSRESALGLHCRDSMRITVKAEWQAWSKAAACRIAALLLEIKGQPWRTHVLHMEHVKSYAPHVDHIVLDLECRPT